MACDPTPLSDVSGAIASKVSCVGHPWAVLDPQGPMTTRPLSVPPAYHMPTDRKARCVHQATCLPLRPTGCRLTVSPVSTTDLETL
jgi:hypothetical protein